MDDEENVRRAVAAARKQADIVVASFHWGIEFHDFPVDRQRHLAHVAVDAGADLILGHHPHVCQGIEVVHARGRNCLIDYSLGNFVFDTHLGWNKDPESTIILKVKFDKSGLRSASIVPVIIHKCAPSIAAGADAETVERRMKKLSAKLGTSIVGDQVRFER
jgi:poly-gamma-glutamate synthesis protein (capsule biosynthesis protein)